MPPFCPSPPDSGASPRVAQIWAIASVVNRHDEFRMTLDEAGGPAVWREVHPAFTVFNPPSETFSCLWEPFDRNFGAFHDAASETMARFAGTTELFPQGAPPANVFDISSVPWTTFTGFTLNIDGGWDHFAPIFTLGRYAEREGRSLLPLAVQVHHAVADGFHTARLIEELRALFSDTTWLRA
ncbi:CatA-like O-acetyltransferase [Herbiconiux sp. KACC 21604]|uniref:CatA-like O-acetyltransferase n=1 Tax=unclassified Herbiconiux TaxID=2618217 RepID=UPI001491AF73|nr:CatA-like O-acetyltransferase [Herbiconiux sp. SALV-R1]QJU55422.1 chloramphenicol acetyltransferase CAT [Herbiconiux sp. SALV-R1]WPO86600.1 CatA-like O-acetyltransferase [Herbiconiux sp. KACC 21604]